MWKHTFLKVAANATHLNAEDRNQLISLLKDFNDLFNATP